MTFADNSVVFKNKNKCPLSASFTINNNMTAECEYSLGGLKDLDFELLNTVVTQLQSKPLQPGMCGLAETINMIQQVKCQARNQIPPYLFRAAHPRAGFHTC